MYYLNISIRGWECNGNEKKGAQRRRKQPNFARFVPLRTPKTLLLRSCLENTSKRVSFQTGTPNQRTIYVRLRQEFCRIVRFYAPSVLNNHLFGHFL